MIETIVLEYLKKALPVPVYPERPSEEPEEYVLIEKTGSSKENHIDSATFVLQSYAGSLLKAVQLNEMVKTAMDHLYILDEVYDSKLNTDYNYTDQAKKKYRYQAVYDLYF